MIYNWVSVTPLRYYDPNSLQNPIIEDRPIFNRMGGYLDTKGAVDGVFSYAVQAAANVDDVVLSVVQDFREAVGAAFFDEAKDDPTLVPSSCLVHIDAIVIYTIYLKHSIVDFSNSNLYVYMAESYKAAKKRATIYRREQAVYLKRWLVGDLFPDQEVPATGDGVPFYTLSDPNKRSL